MQRNRWAKLATVAAVTAALLPAAQAAQAATETNVARTATATATVLGLPAATCSATSGPENAIDGAYTDIYNDKWCVPTGQPTLNLKLNGSASGYTISHIVIRHAGAAGENTTFNTRAFRLRVVQTSSTVPLTVATVTANVSSVTTHSVTLPNVSQVQLLIDSPTQAGIPLAATRIYEVEVWGVPTAAPAPPPPSTCLLPGQKIGNPGFESGTIPWVTTSSVVTNVPLATETAHSGTSYAWMGGYGTTHTDSLQQTVVIPVGCKISLAFWLHVDTDETTTTSAFDKITVQINTTSVAGYSNLNKVTGYALHTLDVSQFAGLTVTLKFTATEDASSQTSFTLDDIALNAS